MLKYAFSVFVAEFVHSLHRVYRPSDRNLSRHSIQKGVHSKYSEIPLKGHSL